MPGPQNCRPNPHSAHNHAPASAHSHAPASAHSHAPASTPVAEEGHAGTCETAAALGPRPSGWAAGSWSRRQFLSAVGAGSAALAIQLERPAQARAASAGPLTGLPASRLAMHVHGAWSEGTASWEAQFRQAADAGIDVLYLTDHDTRAQAWAFLKSLGGVRWVTATTGTASAHRSSAAGGSVHLLVESATSEPAGALMSIDAEHQAKNRLRSSISGLSLAHAFGAVTLTDGALYEVRLSLSYHPAAAGRPAGVYHLVYRFGDLQSARFTERDGLYGVVTAPTPAPGTVVTLTPENDVAALWPSMAAIDNALFGLSLAVVSQRSGSLADVTVASCSIDRRRNGAPEVICDQAALVSRYAVDYPAVRGRAICEIGRTETHLNPFGVPQFFPTYPDDTATAGGDDFYYGVVADVHSRGGVVSINHPLGYTESPLATQAEQVAIRRAAYTWLAQRGLYGCDVLEVGYSLRAHCDASQHLALWDTLSRNGRFVTGNGVTDDHNGRGWGGLVNGFFTGVWAASSGEADVVAALRAGRAFTAHLGGWPDGWIDLLVDGGAAMGSVLVSGLAKHHLTILTGQLPAGAVIEVIRGPVDYSGAVDPASVVGRILPEASFAAGTCTISIATPCSMYWRVQVRDATGNIVGISNPVWILHDTPPGGVPAARRA